VERDRRWRNLLLAVLVLSVLILVPFVLWEDRMNEWTATIVNSQRSAGFVAAAVALLLASDVVLPIPSSLISTSGAFLLGFTAGLAASWTGMTLGCVIGYGLGRFAGRGLLRRVLSEQEMKQSAEDLRSRGDWILAASRAVPMLAEASVIMAGALHRPFPRFLAVCLLANFGISLVYAAVGAFSIRMESFLLAFAGAIVIPWIGMRVARSRKPTE
jgi:uncharacterized membrane protein YdjX (TVP38/TMEM64 family)